MRYTFLAVTAALAIAIGTIPTIAAEAEKGHSQSGSEAGTAFEKDCADILANGGATHTEAQKEACRAKQQQQ